MKSLPQSENALVLRVDFSDSAAWDGVSAAICAPSGEFRAYVDFVSDVEYDGLSPEDVCSLMPPEAEHTFIFMVDRMTLVHPEHPILVVDTFHEPGRTFRVIPSEMASVENNLSIANMDFVDFAESVDEDGVFRGFNTEW